HPSDSLSLQPGKSPLQRSSPAGSSRVGPLLQVPSRDIRTPGHASRRVHKTTFPQPTGAVVTPAAASPPSSHLDHAADDLVQEGGSCGNLGTESIATARSVRPMHE